MAALPGSLPARAAHQLGDALHDLVDAEAGGVQLHGVVGGAKRGMLALGVLSVAKSLVALHGGGVGAQLGGAALRTLLRAGREEDLDRRLGRDDRADVTALGNPVAGAQERALFTSAARTFSLVAMREAASETSGARIASVTSRPSASTRSPISISSSSARSDAAPPSSSSLSAAARYMAPESR